MQNPLRCGVSGVIIAAFMTAAPLTLNLIPATAYAQDSASANNPTVDIDLRDARLEDAIAILKVRSGIKDIVLLNPENKRFGAVTVTLTSKPLDIVLRAITTAAGAQLTLTDGIYYISPRGSVDVPGSIQTASAPQQAVPQPQEIAPRRGNRILVKIPLMFVKPSDFVRAMDDPAIIISYMKVPVLSNPNAEIPKTPALMMLGGDNVVRPMGAGVGAGQADGGLQGAGQIPGGFNRGGGGIGGPQGGAQQGQGSLRPEGIDTIISNDADNALIVRSQTPEAIEELRQIIRLLDIKPRQVLVKAEFVSTSINDSDGFGIDWQFTPSQNLDVKTTGLGNGSSIAVAYASGNAVAALRAALLRNTTNLIQSPVISTLNNTPASINVATSTPIFSTTTVFNNNQTITNTTQSNVVATNTLQVTPHINGDGTITLGVFPQLQDNTTVTGPNGNNGVRQSTTNLSTTRIIRSGETMVVGGFVTKQETRSSNDVPFLSSLPIIGKLFQSRDRTVTSSEVLVFLTPTIIEDTPTGLIGTGGGQTSPTP